MRFYELPRGTRETILTTDKDEYHIVIFESELADVVIVSVLSESEILTLSNSTDTNHRLEFHFDMADDILVDIGRNITISVA